jgi:hypothetical protein
MDGHGMADLKTGLATLFYQLTLHYQPPLHIFETGLEANNMTIIIIIPSFAFLPEIHPEM